MPVESFAGVEFDDEGVVGAFRSSRVLPVNDQLLMVMILRGSDPEGF